MKSDTPLKLFRTFACPSCRGPIELHTGDLAVTAACSYCGAVIDAADPNLRIVQGAKDATGSGPLIKLGTRGKLSGVEWAVVGFLKRSDSADRWTWDEYLLFNPYRGYRWLVHSEGKFTFVETLQEPVGEARKSVDVDGVSYRTTNVGKARVDRVVGEFFWRVQVGDLVSVRDYESGGRSSLSMERDAHEVTWSRGEPINAAALQAAFPELDDDVFVGPDDSDDSDDSDYGDYGDGPYSSHSTGGDTNALELSGAVGYAVLASGVIGLVKASIVGCICGVFLALFMVNWGSKIDTQPGKRIAMTSLGIAAVLIMLFVFPSLGWGYMLGGGGGGSYTGK